MKFRKGNIIIETQHEFTHIIYERAGFEPVPEEKPIEKPIEHKKTTIRRK